MGRPDPRSPGVSFLAVLAAPGLFAGSCWAYAFLFPEAEYAGCALWSALAVGLVAFGAAVPACYVRAPLLLRCGVALLNLVAFGVSVGLPLCACC